MYRRRKSGAFPLASWLTQDVSALRKRYDSERAHCCRSKGLYPNRPAAEQGAKELRATETTSLLK
jgi:hypothetical protein